MTLRAAFTGLLFVVVGCAAKKPAPEPAPAVTATAEPVVASSPGVVVASMADDFKRCWETERATSNPPSRADGTLTIKIEPNGTVSSAVAAGIDQPTLAACLEAVGKSTKFAPVEPPGANMTIPVNL